MRKAWRPRGTADLPMHANTLKKAVEIYSEVRERLVPVGRCFAETSPEGIGSRRRIPHATTIDSKFPAALSVARVNGLRGGRLDPGP